MSSDLQDELFIGVGETLRLQQDGSLTLGLPGPVAAGTAARDSGGVAADRAPGTRTNGA